ncbi:hypothetical protein D3C78_1682250 [compost metagenome]
MHRGNHRLRHVRQQLDRFMHGRNQRIDGLHRRLKHGFEVTAGHERAPNSLEQHHPDLGIDRQTLTCIPEDLG